MFVFYSLFCNGTLGPFPAFQCCTLKSGGEANGTHFVLKAGLDIIIQVMFA